MMEVGWVEREEEEKEEEERKRKEEEVEDGVVGWRMEKEERGW